MPTLHELFDAATDGMPPLPDLAPSARRIVRRRQLATRTSAAVLASALVIGAGTFALAVHPGNTRDAASGPPQAFSQQYVLETLQSLWPNKNEQLSLEPGSTAILISQDGTTLARMYFSVLADVANFPEELSCVGEYQQCVQATTGDGDKVQAESGALSSIQVNFTPTALPSLSSSPPPVESTPSAFPGKTPGFRVDQEYRAYRLHGTYFGQLNIAGTETQLSDQQLLAVMESPAYEQLIESAVAASSLDWFGTPPAGTPGASTIFIGDSPAPSDSAG